jgi:hypothetical protein
MGESEQVRHARGHGRDGRSQPSPVRHHHRCGVPKPAGNRLIVPESCFVLYVLVLVSRVTVSWYLLAKLCMQAIIHMGLLLVLDVVYNHFHGTDSRDHHLGSDKVVCI